ncbi:IS200/IS605 family element transposase accessory protein TnpB [Salicibibacter cibarius]|uniref:IS200/IS605 family element transposase accessory protein TnpB n=1 Tax=Salicibibacter cibarius TaxID=2743000 RepID=A0A7T6Z6H5_9BACI|nr:RNA-guided endonuclease TnpB family protein [Salicibibacter cibarius]QQK77693.1 IS200/IS605 family element transposase accessory protein TnpB [Salicibibacter cibarius]
MLVRMNYKYEMFPNKDQMETMNCWLSICRQQYNSALLDKQRFYQKNKTGLSRHELQKQQTKDKQTFPLLKTMPSQPLQEVFFRLEEAYKNFFEGRARYPKIKKHKDYQSLTFTQFGVEKRKVKNKKTGKVNVRDVRYAASLGENNHLLISKLGSIYVNFHRSIEGKVKQVTIKRQGHRWFAIFSVERHVNETVDFPVQSTGVDVGIHKFAVLSDGSNVENPRFLLKTEKKLKRAQKKLSRMKQGSNNWKKQRLKVQQLHIKVANQRRDFLHKRSYHLSKTYKFVFVEDLKIRNMVKNRHLAKSIYDAGWGAFCRKLEYKCKNNGGELVRIKPHYTSQDCSSCGKRVKKALSVRTHVCKSCGTVLDRDHNAAINIEKVGLDLYGLSPTL